MSGTSKAVVHAVDRQIITALTTYFAASATFTLGGTVYKVSELTKLFQDRIDADNGADAQRAAWLVAVAEARGKAAAVATLLPLLRGAVVGTYGPESKTAVDFGFVKKTSRMSAAVRAQAVEKSLATRKARGTLGKNQRAKIKGAPPVAPPATSGSAPTTTT
jgi:hypothetical protein